MLLDVGGSEQDVLQPILGSKLHRFPNGLISVLVVMWSHSGVCRELVVELLIRNYDLALVSSGMHDRIEKFKSFLVKFHLTPHIFPETLTSPIDVLALPLTFPLMEIDPIEE
jgi:hypothetical protein